MCSQGIKHLAAAVRGYKRHLHKIVHPFDDESYLLDSLQYVQTIMVYLPISSVLI